MYKRQPRALEECGAFGDPSHGPCDGAPARGKWTWRRHADPASPGAPGRTLRGSMANTYGTATLLRRGGDTVVASDGDPVAVSQMGRMDLAGIVRERALDVLQMYQVSFLEDCLQEARARSAREGRLVRCHTLIDLDGLSVLVAARCIRKILPPIAKVAQQYYPEVNSSNTAINAPMGVESLWRIVQLFIDENMRQKVRIVGRSYKGALVDHARNKYEGEFKDGLKHGVGEQTYADGAVYKGEWVRGERHGVGHLVKRDGETFAGSWVAGRPHGEGTLTRPDGTAHAGGFVRGAPHGWGVVTTASEERECAFVDGVAVEDDVKITYGAGGQYDGTSHGSMAVGSVQAWTVSGNDKHPVSYTHLTLPTKA